MSEAKVYDKEAAMDRVDNDLELFYELIDMLFSEHEASVSTMRSAIESGDGTVLEETAHSCKSAFGNLGAMQVFDLAYALEKSGKAGVSADSAALLEKFVAAVNEFRSIVEGERE